MKGFINILIIAALIVIFHRDKHENQLNVKRRIC